MKYNPHADTYTCHNGKRLRVSKTKKEIIQNTKTRKHLFALKKNAQISKFQHAKQTDHLDFSKTKNKKGGMPHEDFIPHATAPCM